MNYREIALGNQALFGELEALTLQIAYYAVQQHEEEVQRLSQQKEGIRSLVNINLELLDDLWNLTSLRAYKWPKNENLKLFTLKERRMIADYVGNPNIPIVDIGKKHGLLRDSAHRVITAYLTKKYK